VGNPAPAAILPPNKNLEPFTLAPPTPDQLANVDRRVSYESHRIPLSITSTQTRGYYAPGRLGSRFDSRDYAMGPVPPTAPRAAWGAAGVFGSLPFIKAHRNANSNSNPNTVQRQIPAPNLSIDPRTGSRDSQRSISHSSSSPNLLIQPALQTRPQYGRLDTIESITSAQTYNPHGPRNLSRSHSVTQSLPTIGGSPFVAPLTGPRVYDPHYLIPNSDSLRAGSSLGYFSGGRERRAKTKKRTERKVSDASTQDGGAAMGRLASAEHSERRKASKCLIM
jgi:hypothetical protein